MPTSDYSHIPQVLDEVCRLMPQRVLEIGIGFGKWGVLLREVLDARYGRVASGTWQTVIMGIEIFGDYSNPAWDVYNLVGVANVVEREYAGYDLILMMDVLEHFEEAIGRKLLDRLVAQNRQVIVSVPNGRMDQGAVYGNPHEAHLTTFYGPEFDKYEHRILHLGLCRVISIKGALA